MVLMLRRIFLVAISIVVDHAALQIMSILYINIIIDIYIGLVKPFERVQRNRIEFANETFIAAASIHLLIFTAFVPEQER